MSHALIIILIICVRILSFSLGIDCTHSLFSTQVCDCQTYLNNSSNIKVCYFSLWISDSDDLLQVFWLRIGDLLCGSCYKLKSFVLQHHLPTFCHTLGYSVSLQTHPSYHLLIKSPPDQLAQVPL